MQLRLIAFLVLAGPAFVIAATQPIVATPKTDLFAGLEPDARVIAFLKAPESPDQSGSCPPGSAEASVPERSSWLRSIFGWVEAHVLRVETALASGIECDTGCFGHYQGPKNLFGCGLYGGCGTYCASDPTEFYWEDGCIDCTINDPDNDCDGCSVDQGCSHPPIGGGADSNSAVSPIPGGETP